MHIIKYFTSKEYYDREMAILGRVAGLDPGGEFTTPGKPFEIDEVPAECPGATHAIRYMYGGPTIK